MIYIYTETVTREKTPANVYTQLPDFDPKEGDILKARFDNIGPNPILDYKVKAFRDPLEGELFLHGISAPGRLSVTRANSLRGEIPGNPRIILEYAGPQWRLAPGEQPRYGQPNDYLILGKKDSPSAPGVMEQAISRWLSDRPTADKYFIFEPVHPE